MFGELNDDKETYKIGDRFNGLKWFAAKMHHHCRHNEKQKETMSTKLKHYMDK